MTAASVVTWVSLAWCLVMAVVSTWLTIRNHRANRKLASYWQRQAPPVPPVRVRLRTGETLTVQPDGPQQTWTWFVRMPRPELVDEVEIPELPPWTSVIPVPDTGP
jgi:hypothetical protein